MVGFHSEMKTIILSQWCEFPAGRVREDGPHSAQAFLEDVLIDALRDNPLVVLHLDTPLASSFLQEMCAGLVGHFAPNLIRSILRIEAPTDQSLVEECWDYILS